MTRKPWPGSVRSNLIPSVLLLGVVVLRLAATPWAFRTVDLDAGAERVRLVLQLLHPLCVTLLSELGGVGDEVVQSCQVHLFQLAVHLFRHAVGLHGDGRPIP